MSNYYPAGSGEPYSSSSSREYLQLVIDELRANVGQKVADLEHLYNHEGNYLKRTSLFVQRQMLSGLASYALLMAEDQNNRIAIHVDNIVLPDYSPDYIEAAGRHGLTIDSLKQAYTQGAISGTDDLLTFLAPPEALRNGEADVYFLRWRRDYFEQLHDLDEHPDGSASISLETSLPNVYIDYHYLQGRTLPWRTIFFRDEQ